ncbi:erythromycin esterase family protein [Actinophytocola xanthii]|uniref:Erythromycin esterase n=1 Tax=Actinophytocola xanthii TaxID=1912961 RepID=A0A1Q8C2N6_9PSEU|nr:erythromycin esterase family protein [Actinophytocola xanthii]OLF08616.1 hypothetical protein BU204_33935 [Actinophytocola xanthii]
MRRHLIAGFAAGLLVVAASPASAGQGQDPVVAALEAAARPLQAFAEIVGDASLVGVGEATHGSHEFFDLQRRVFIQLVRQKGFRAFAREVSWSAGLRLDEYVMHGTGDLRQIMREEFQGSYLWNTEEHLDLLEWMREYNIRHREPLRFVGSDIGYPGPELFDRVRAGVARSRPALLADVDRLYRDMAPRTGAGEWMSTYPMRPLAERKSFRDRAWQALNLLRDNGLDAWTEQHARVIAQSMRMWASDFTDPAEAAAGFRYRDEAMADNVLWWAEHTGDRMVLAAHDGHVATTSYWANYPSVQGTFLRERWGQRYLSVGTTFHHGTFALLDRTNGGVRQVSVGPPPPNSNESTLDKVRRSDFVLDARAAPAVTRDWLAVARPTRQYAESFPDEDKSVALGRSFDVVVHVHRSTPSRLLP